MKKPIKPKKPLKNESLPSKTITVCKLLVSLKNKYLLVDQKSHPDVFSDPETKTISQDLTPYCDSMEELSIDWDFDRLKYSDYKKIAEDCRFTMHDQGLFVDFEIEHVRDNDGYYNYSIVRYNTPDPEYDSKIEKYSNRFTEYEKQVQEYEIELKKYEEFKKSEKKKKLELELEKLS
jgi:hypothetical protein